MSSYQNLGFFPFCQAKHTVSQLTSSRSWEVTWPGEPACTDSSSEGKRRV